MEQRKVLCLVPSSVKYLRDDCVPAIQNQTMKVDKLIIEPVPNGGELYDRVMVSLNNALARVNLSEYDYILRVDGDCVLGKRYLEHALTEDFDLYGPGCAMVIKVSTFQKVMGGRFKYADDPYLRGLYKLLKKKVVLGNDDFLHEAKRTFKQRTTRGFYEGIMHHKEGWIPVQLMYDVMLDIRVGYNPLESVVQIYGYFFAKIRKLPQYDIARRIQLYQIRRIFRGKAN